MRYKHLAATLTLLMVVAGPGHRVLAASGAEGGSGPTPPRLSFIDGEVSFWRPGAEDWSPAQVNTPLAPGDALFAGDGGNFEVEMSPGAFVRGGAGAELGLESLEKDLRQFKLTAGHAAVDVSRLPKGQAIEVDTPSAAFTIEGPGYYRVDVEDDRATFSARRGGRATMVPADGEATDVDPDTQVVLEGTETPKVTSRAAPDPDEWDRWNLDRNKPATAPSRSAPYVSPEVAGREDLDRHGEWRDTPSYGHVWVPRDVPPDWAPYSTGRWMYDPYYGWTWIDDAPWGWAPYHYGRWVYYDDFWGWAPGPVVVAPVYAPALVAFFGPRVTVSVGVPFVSWVALGFGEPLIPWWGPVGFHGRCWWGGWGGPRYVNNVVIQRNTYVNVRNVTVFRNQRVHNAVIAVDREHFGRGRPERMRLRDADAAGLRPVRGNFGVKPTPASMAPRDGRGKRPAERVHERAVVATRPPQDVSQRLRAAGLEGAGAGAGKPPRLVRPAKERGAVQQPSPAERRTPPPPRVERRQPGQAGTRVAPPPRDARPERREPGSPHQRGAQRPEDDVRHAPEPAGGGPTHTTPPPPHRSERQVPAAPSPPRHIEHERPMPPSTPPRTMERERPGRNASPAQQPPRERGPQQEPHERTPRSAPHGNPQEPGPAGSPSARRNAPRSPRSWTGPQRAEHTQAGRRDRPPQRAATRGTAPRDSRHLPR